MRSLLALASLVSILLAAPVSAQAPLVRVVRVAPRAGAGPDESAVVDRALRAHRASFVACQERRVAQGASYRGRLDVTLVVPPGEATPEAEVTRRASDPDPALEACLLQMMRRLRITFADARTDPATFQVVLAVSAPPESPPLAAADAASVRSEIAAAREEARCLTRAAGRLERLLAALERAGPRRREAIAVQIAEARAASAACGASLFGSLGTGTGLTGVGIGDHCAGCLRAGGGLPDGP
jgi:hypothetical protein